MADEVVGSVRLDVGGNTDPLKRDIQRAALEAGKAIDAGVGKGAGGSSITDNIVDQVADAEQPAGKEAQKVGRAIAKGIDVGAEDTDVTRQINENLKQAEAPLRAQAERLGKRLGAALGMHFADANRDAVAEMRSDVKVKIGVDREQFRADLSDSQRDWFDFGQAMGASIDRALGPWWKRLPQRLRRAFDDDRGSVQIGPRRLGERMGQNLILGIGRGIIGASDWLGGKIFSGIGKVLLSVGPQAALYGAGARFAAVLGGGLLAGLTTVGQGVAGWASGIVGQVGQALVGVSTVMVGTIGTAFAGLGATAYSSIAAIAPALLGLKFAFKGLEKDEKKALEDRFKEATKSFKGFGQAVRGELIEPLFAALKTFEKFVPTLKTFGSSLGKTAAGLVTSFASVMTAGPVIGQVNTFLQSSVGYFKQVGEAAIGLAPAVLGAFNAIAPVTQKFFDGVAKGLESLTGWLERVSEGGKDSALTTTLDEWYERGRALIEVFKTVAGAVVKIFDAAVTARGDAFLGSLQKVADNFSDFINRVSADGRLESKLGQWYDQGKDLANAFGNLTKIVLLFFDSAGNAAGDALGGFKETTDRWLATFKFFRASGQLDGLIEEWFDQGKQLLDILGNVGRTVGHVLGVAAGNSDDFLTSFERMTAGWERWTTSFTGQQTLKDYFSGAESVLGEVIGLFGDLAKVFGPTFTAPADNLKGLFQTIREVWVPAIEGLVDSFRDSGIQDAIFNIVKALGGLDDGGVIGKTFEMLAVALDGIAKALQIMAPFVPAFVTFVAAVKTLALLKLGAKALGLVALADGIKAIAAARIAAAGAAATGVASAATAGAGGSLAAGAARAAGVTAGAGAAGSAVTAAGSAGLAAGAAALAPLVAAAAVAAGAFLLVNKAISGTKDNVDRFASASDLTVKQQAEGYANSLSTFEKWGGAVKDFATDWHNLIPGVGILNGFKSIGKVFGEAATDARTLDFIGESMDQFSTEVEKLATSGNYDQAYDRIAQLKKLIEESGGDTALVDNVEALQDAVNSVQIEDLTNDVSALAQSGDWEVASEKAGQMIATLAASGVDTSKLEEIRNWTIDLLTATAQGDAVVFTGTYDPKFMEQAEADLKKVEGMWKNGDWTEAGRKAKAELIAGFQQSAIGPELQKELDEIPKTLRTFDPSKGAGGRWTKDGLRLRAKVFAEADYSSINGVENAIDDATENKIVDIYANPENYDATTGELKNEFKEKVVELQLTGIEKAKKDLKELGIQRTTRYETIKEILSTTRPGSAERSKRLADAEKQYQESVKGLEPTTVKLKVISELEKDTYNAVINDIEDTPADLTIDPDLRKITSPKIQSAIDEYYAEHPLTVEIIPKLAPLPDSPTTPRPGSGGSGYPFGSNQTMVTPSMISPGGPSTMGFGSNLGPVGLAAVTRAGIAIGGDQVVGSPNYKGDKDKISKNVTINNYYPKPERTSDTIAMQMRLAKYA